MNMGEITFRTFLRSATSFESFSRAEKITQSCGLTLTEARYRCKRFNESRTPEQIAGGTKCEFEKE